jgi:hypothetical protein
MGEENFSRITECDLDHLTVGPIRHATLPPELLARITKMKSILSEVDDSSFEETVDDFRRDTHPEQEIAIWETMASVYREYLLFNRDLTLDQKRDVFSVILTASMGGTSFGNVKNLDQAAIADIVNLYEKSHGRT